MLRVLIRGTAAVAATVAVAGCAATTAGSGSIAADVPAGATGPATPAPGAGTGTRTGLPVPTTTPAPAATASATPAGRTVAFGTVRLALPAVWTAKVDGTLLCLTVSGDDGCTLVVVDIGRIRAEGGSVSTPDPAAEFGWWYGSDVPNCDPTGGAYVPVTRSAKVPGPATKPVGPKTALYGSWLVSCQDSDLDFDPRLWWLPTSKLAFVERSTVAGSGEAVDALLRAVRFAG